MKIPVFKCGDLNRSTKRLLYDQKEIVEWTGDVELLKQLRGRKSKQKQLDDNHQVVHIPFCCNKLSCRISSRRLRNHPFLKGCMIQGDTHFFAEKDCLYEYNITSLSLRCLSPYATEIRHLFEHVKVVSEYVEDQNEPCDHSLTYSILPNPVGKRKQLDEKSSSCYS